MKLLSAAMLAGGLASLVAVAPAHAYQCKTSPTAASAAAILKTTAQSKAVAAWSSKVKSNYGLSWSVWNIAKNKGVSCTRIGTKWTCEAKAIPCNYVVP